MYNPIKKLINKDYSFRTIYRASVAGMVLGTALGVYLMVEAVPTIKTAYADFSERVNPTIVYTAPERVTATSSQEQIEIYYTEELTKLQKKYEQAHKDEARSNAIERVEEDLEAEKEAIRERAILQ